MRAYTRIQLRIEISAYKEKLLRCMMGRWISAELYNFLYSLINNFMSFWN